MIVGLVISEKLRTVRLAKDHGTRRAQPGDGRGITGGYVAGPIKAADECRITGDIKAIFDSDRYARQRPVAAGGRVEHADKRTEMGVRRLHTLPVRAQQFRGRDIAAAERIALFFECPVNHFSSLENWTAGQVLKRFGEHTGSLTLAAQ